MKCAKVVLVLSTLALGMFVPQPAEGGIGDLLVCYANCRFTFPFDRALRQFCYRQCERLCTPLAVSEPTPPVCRLAARTASSITVETQDSDGLAAIVVLESENANTVVPPFAEGTMESVFVQSSKIDPNLPSRVELSVIDAAEPCPAITVCDPVLTSVIRTTGRPVAESHSGLPQEEKAVTIFNGSPGLAHLDVIVNGTRFKVKDLADYEERTIDVSPAMLPGNVNTISLKTEGKPGASAAVLIWDGVDE